MLNQKLQQRLIQKLSPQQVLVMRLLQEPILSLDQRIKQEIEENPALEENTKDEDELDAMDEEPTVDSIDSASCPSSAVSGRISFGTFCYLRQQII